MSTATLTLPPAAPSLAPAAVPPRKLAVARWSVEGYHRLIDAGILTEDDRLELLEGWMVFKMPHGPEHDGTVDLCDVAITPCLPAGWRTRIQSAITTTDSEPEPDVAVVRGDVRSHLTRHPAPDETALIVEVSDSTLDQDRDVKGRLYARARIPAYWIINLVDRQVEVYTDPGGPVAAPAYQQRTNLRRGDRAPLVIDGRHVADVPVDDLLP